MAAYSDWLAGVITDSLAQNGGVTFTAPSKGVLYLDENGWRFVSNKEAAIDRIKEQPFFGRTSA